ncbi:IMP dehydrogenase, partial [Corallococcus exiguus]|uniref:IMP dehydrogenase n=1 Tax=Corallococcus exiguus TaxID=83462 RepID=UPI00155FECFA
YRTDPQGRLYKTSYGMASSKAVSQRFAQVDPLERARKMLFSEGISESRIYVDIERPSVEDLIDQITAGVRSSCTYAGAENLAQFTENALVGIQSAAGYDEGRALPQSW